jgi:hypothetical protein
MQRLRVETPIGSCDTSHESIRIRTSPSRVHNGELCLRDDAQRGKNDSRQMKLSLNFKSVSKSGRLFCKRQMRMPTRRIARGRSASRTVHENKRANAHACDRIFGLCCFHSSIPVVCKSAAAYRIDLGARGEVFSREQPECPSLCAALAENGSLTVAATTDATNTTTGRFDGCK